MYRHIPLIIAVFLVLMPSTLTGQTTVKRTLSKAKASAVDAAVSSEMKKQKVVGAAIGIIQNGEIVYLKGYGQADREKDEPVTTETVFNWASNSKPLAAVAAMQLVEKKQLDLNADVRQYVPEFPDKGTVIKVGHLLCHQSGIPHYSNGKVFPTDRTYESSQPFLDPVLALDTFNLSPLLFQPGEKESYSSYAYILLSAAIQRAGKEPFMEQIQQRIAGPLKMASLQYDVEWKEQSDWAAGYVEDDQGKIVRASERAEYWKHGAGGFKSNIQDFARWAQALIGDRILSVEGKRIAWNPQATANGAMTEWGLGFVVEQQRGQWKISHNGSQVEATSRLVIYPQSKEGVVVMTNSNFAEVGAISTAIFSALSRK